MGKICKFHVDDETLKDEAQKAMILNNLSGATMINYRKGTSDLSKITMMQYHIKKKLDENIKDALQSVRMKQILT